MFLLQLLRLLLVLLFDLLRSGFIGLLFRQPLVFLFLLLLEFLVFLFLLRVKFFLLLLVFLVQFRVPRVWRSGASMRWKVLRMDCSGGRGTLFSGRAACSLPRCPVRATIGWRMIWRSRLFGRHGSASPLQFPRPGSGRNRRPAMVDRSPLLWVVARSRLMLSLSRYRWECVSPLPPLLLQALDAPLIPPSPPL